MAAEDETPTALLQELQQRFSAFLVELSQRATILAGVPQPMVPLPLDKNSVDVDTLSSRFAASINAAAARFARSELSLSTYLYLHGKQLATIFSDHAQVTPAAGETLARHIHAATGSWFSSLLNLWASKAVNFSSTDIESLAVVLRTAFTWKFQTLSEQGFQSLYSRPPVIYVSESTPASLIAGISTLLMLPKRSVRHVKSAVGSSKLDLEHLETLIEQDIEEGFSPCVILARAESHATGELDDLLAIRVLCEKHHIWMHLQGSGLGVLALSKIPTASLTAAVTADSVSFNPAIWFQIPASPVVTCFRTSMPSVVASTHDLSLVLPLWLVLQHHGQNNLIATIARSIETATILVQTLSNAKSIHVLPRTFDGQYVLFRFAGTQQPLSDSFAEGLGNDRLVAENTVTRILFDYVRALAISIGADLITHNGQLFFRFRPFGLTPIDPSAVESLAVAIVEQANIYEATWNFQKLFEKTCEEKRLLVVPVENWFGLGAVRYIPSFVDPKTLSQKSLADLDDLNAAILARLQEENAKLFQQGYVLGSTQVCIRIGVYVPAITESEVISLVDIIIATAAAVEKTSKFMDDIAENIKRGIESAQNHIQQQMESELEEDLLRQIPIVGSLYSLFSPEEPKKKKTGRYFSLQNGKLGPSEEVIQVSHIAPPTPNKTTTPATAPVVPHVDVASPSEIVHAEAPVETAVPVVKVSTDLAYVRERTVAVDAVIRACRVCESVFVDLVSENSFTKTDHSPVTVGDFAAQAVIHTLLHQAFPHDRIIAEEESKELRSPENEPVKKKVIELTNAVLDEALPEEQLLNNIDLGRESDGTNHGRVWALDPIDGTSGFLRGGQYAVCLTLIENGEPVMAVMGCPNLPLDSTIEGGDRGCLFLAVKAQGAWQRPIRRSPEGHLVRLHVSTSSDFANAVVCESFEESHSAHQQVSEVASKLGVVRPSLRFDSQCKYACVARGEASIYLRLQAKADYVEKIWDHASGWLLVHEAGGRVTDAHGQPLNFSAGRTLSGNSGIVATNGVLHENVLKAIAEVTQQHE